MFKREQKRVKSAQALRDIYSSSSVLFATPASRAAQGLAQLNCLGVYTSTAARRHTCARTTLFLCDLLKAQKCGAAQDLATAVCLLTLPCVVAGTLVTQVTAATARQRLRNDVLARSINAALSRLTAANPRLDAGCTSTLLVSDLFAAGFGEPGLRDAETLLEPIFDISARLTERKPVVLGEALVYLRGTRLCETLLSLLRRWPWADMRQERTARNKGLEQLPGVLESLFTFLHLPERVPGSDKAAAYAEASKRCLC